MGKGGKADVGTKDSNERLRGIFSEFLQPNFAAASYASNALTDISVTAQVPLSFFPLIFCPLSP